MLAAASGDAAPSMRQHAVLLFEPAQAFVAIVARIDIKHQQRAVGAYAIIRALCLIAEPMFDDAGFGAGAQQAIRRGQTVWMLRRAYAIAFSTAGANQPAAFLDRPAQWQNLKTPAAKTERVAED